MLETLTLTGLECFGNIPLPIQERRDATFIFGANGSGKAPISRSLADSSSVRWDRQTGVAVAPIMCSSATRISPSGF